MAKFTVEHKIRAARNYLTGHESKEEIAKRYGVNAEGLQQWVELNRHHGEDGLRKRNSHNATQSASDL